MYFWILTVQIKDTNKDLFMLIHKLQCKAYEEDIKQILIEI